MGSMIRSNDIYPVPASPELLSLLLGTEWRVNLPECIVVLKVFQRKEQVMGGNLDGT